MNQTRKLLLKKAKNQREVTWEHVRKRARAPKASRSTLKSSFNREGADSESKCTKNMGFRFWQDYPCIRQGVRPPANATFGALAMEHRDVCRLSPGVIRRWTLHPDVLFKQHLLPDERHIRALDAVCAKIILLLRRPYHAARAGCERSIKDRKPFVSDFANFSTSSDLVASSFLRSAANASAASLASMAMASLPSASES